jgi:hypothetical protein
MEIFIEQFINYWFFREFIKWFLNKDTMTFKKKRTNATLWLPIY